jgi:hypothetical protein
MAVLHKKEEKIQAVLGRLPKKYSPAQFVELFIQLYSKDWGKIKAAYVKQSQDKEPGTVINMPKPALYLEQVLASYLQKNAQDQSNNKKQEVEIQPEAPVAVVEKPKVAAKKAAESEEIAAAMPAEAPAVVVKKAKAPAKKKAVDSEEIAAAVPAEAPAVVVKKAKAPAKKKAVDSEIPPVAAAKKTTTKKKVESTDEVVATKKPKAATKKTTAEKK